MDYKLFTQLCEESVEGLNSYTSSYDMEEDAYYVDPGYIVQKHVTGGADGGNCWGDEARQFINSHPPKEFIPLDKILRAACKNISYLGYKELSDLIERTSHIDNDYYGNYTEFDTYKLSIKKLYDHLFLNNLFDE